ncbi:MAG: hypothetical protein AAGA54_07305 [Myxococcota bacterium]
MRRFSWAALAVLLACGGDDSRPPDGAVTLGGLTTLGGTDASASDSADGTDGADGIGGSDDGGAGSSASASGGTPGFDVGSANPDGDQNDGCQKVDVVFAVDNSGSMSEEHDALRGPVFDSFPQQLLDINNGIEDFRLGVIDACPKPAWFHSWGASGACNFSTGTNYMSSTSPSLAAEFSCVTAFSDQGFENMPDQCVDDGAFADDDEQPSLKAAEAVSAVNLAGMNPDFLRDDAILFIVAMTDEDEELADVGSAQEIYNRIVAAKGGDVTNVVYLGVAGGSACLGPYGTALDAVNARGVANLFSAAGQGLFWDLCDGNLETAFQTAISTLVDDTCQGFTPPEG